MSQAERAERFGADDEGTRGGPHHALQAVALAPLFHQLHEAGGLQRAQVIVDALAGKAEPTGQAAGGVGLGKLSQELLADRIQQGGGGLGLADDAERGYRCHGSNLASTRFFVKTAISVGWPAPGAGSPQIPGIIGSTAVYIPGK